ncbi:MAG: Co2+/Mg2+ efflux protein ApaG [Pseudomonadota bacterium]
MQHLPADHAFERETSGILVRVLPTYLADESDPGDHRFVWAYTVEIENNSGRAVKLTFRRWTIVDAAGRTQRVEGEGVVGQTPSLQPGESFRYTSGAPLSEPSGLMSGAYDFETDEGDILSVPTPAFSLDSPHETHLPS